MVASYVSYGEDNESLQLSMLVLVPLAIFKYLFKYLEWYLNLGLRFYVETVDLIWSKGQVAISNPKERGHLTENIVEQFRNSGSPERRKSWGDGGFIIARHPGLISSTYVGLGTVLVKGSKGISTKASLPAGFEKLEKLRELNVNDPSHINTKILDLMCDIDVLIAVYTKLNSSPGNMTSGLDSETLDGFDIAWFDKLKKDLRTNAFQFRPRIEISKANGKGMRLLGLTSPINKIVQGAMLLVLETIFEPLFITHSHGFRPGRSCHSALGEIKRTFTSVNWFIEGDISKCFDSFDHKLLVHLISKKINDKGFIDLMYKALKAGYFFQAQYFIPELGNPQGFKLSPILCNILLHGLDEFILNLKKDFEIGTRRKVNPL